MEEERTAKRSRFDQREPEPKRSRFDRRSRSPPARRSETRDRSPLGNESNGGTEKSPSDAASAAGMAYPYVALQHQMLTCRSRRSSQDQRFAASAKGHSTCGRSSDSEFSLASSQSAYAYEQLQQRPCARACPQRGDVRRRRRLHPGH